MTKCYPVVLDRAAAVVSTARGPIGTWNDGTAKKVELLSLSFTNLEGTAHGTALASNPAGESQQ
jgi:hypothetical protein